MKKTMIQISKTLKMQKYFIIVAVTMLSLVSCTKFEDTAPPRKITFGIATYRPQTKADETYKSVTTEFTTFKCKAFLHAENGANAFYATQDMFGANGEDITPYKTGDVVWHNGDTDQILYWAPSHDYYWPKGQNSYINFIAWHDDKGTDPATSSETSLSWTNYTVLPTDNLLFADEAWHYKANATNGPHYDGVTEGVPMIFHHALAQICIKAAVTQTTKTNVTGGSSLGATKWVVTLSNISLERVYNQGTLSLTNSDPGDNRTKEWSATWTITGNSTTISIPNPTSALPAVNDQNGPLVLLGMQSVLPQAIADDDNDDDDDIALSFNYLIRTRFDDGTNPAPYAQVDDKGNLYPDEYAHEMVSVSIPLKDFTGENLGNVWEMNKRITYTVIINPETKIIKIDPAVEEWVGRNGSYSYPNNN